ncbi:MAG: AAA domain-containing protein [bacterium]|nr:AAA domain-containing protein [bacterium]
MLVAVVAGDHLLVVGPPGTAKSALIKDLVALIAADSFEYLLTRFTEPNEIFGPIDMRLYSEEKRFRRITARMLPEADIVFLDEIFKSNSAILNTLLTILNERVFYNGEPGQEGVRPVSVPLISLFAATNAVPDDAELAALLDRFPLRVATANVPEQLTAAMIRSGWELERERVMRQENEFEVPPLLDPVQVRRFSNLVGKVDTGPVMEALLRFLHIARSRGILLSDRRAVRLLRLAAAAALLRRSTRCELRDLWVLRHSWNHPREAESIDQILRDVAGDAAAAQQEARSLDDIQKDVRRYLAAAEQPTTHAEHLASLHAINVLRGELDCHSGDLKTRTSLLGQLHQAAEALVDVMATG